jgi:FKBP-type peptidyl-prolyl cis-trans isomerase
MVLLAKIIGRITDMARKRERYFALFGALLFLITSSALTIAVVWSLIEQNHQTKASTAASTSSQTTPAKTTTPPATTSSSSLASYPQLTASSNLTGDKMENFTPTSTPQTKLEYEDIQVGTGATVTASDTISADYVGALMSTGIIFDASANHGGAQTFPLSGVIAGWTQGIPGMKVGGTRRLLIPAALAYGSQAQTGIPANSDLVFDVTVTKID